MKRPETPKISKIHSAPPLEKAQEIELVNFFWGGGRGVGVRNWAITLASCQEIPGWGLGPGLSSLSATERC